VDIRAGLVGNGDWKLVEVEEGDRSHVLLGVERRLEGLVAGGSYITALPLLSHGFTEESDVDFRAALCEVALGVELWELYLRPKAFEEKPFFEFLTWDMGVERFVGPAAAARLSAAFRSEGGRVSGQWADLAEKWEVRRVAEAPAVRKTVEEWRRWSGRPKGPEPSAESSVVSAVDEGKVRRMAKQWRRYYGYWLELFSWADCGGFVVTTGLAVE
jgi:hypothetical protein